MLLDVGLLCECSPTDDALERFFSRVAASVLLQVKVLREQLVAVLTVQRTWRHRGRRAARLCNRRLHAPLWQPIDGIAVCRCCHGCDKSL